MRSYDDIARRIAKIILSPESAIGFTHGILSVPTDIGYLAYGYMHTDGRYYRETEKIRMLTAIRHGILENHHFASTIETVLTLFNKNISEKKQDAIYAKTVASITGRVVTNAVVAGKLASSIAQRSSLLVKLRGGIVGNTLLIGGMMERCIYTSERLQRNNPEVYNALKPRNYDLLYFLVEPALHPFIEALNIKRLHGLSAFEKILDKIENEIKAKR